MGEVIPDKMWWRLWLWWKCNVQAKTIWWEKFHQLKVVVTNVSGNWCGFNVWTKCMGTGTKEQRFWHKNEGKGVQCGAVMHEPEEPCSLCLDGWGCRWACTRMREKGCNMEQWCTSRRSPVACVLMDGGASRKQCCTSPGCCCELSWKATTGLAVSDGTCCCWRCCGQWERSCGSLE